MISMTTNWGILLPVETGLPGEPFAAHARTQTFVKVRPGGLQIADRADNSIGVSVAGVSP